jgi:spermidine/putrescine transport system permease protein
MNRQGAKTNDPQLIRNLVWPGLIWFSVFLFFPLLIVVFLSFLKRGTYGGIDWTFQFANYARVFSPVYLEIFFSSLKLAALTTILSLLFAYPIAWAIVTAKNKTRSILIALLSIPFLTNLIIRIYAVKLFVGIDGPLQSWLQTMGINIDPFAFSQNPVLVIYMMVMTYLPFMIFPIYSAMEKLDFTIVEAAQDLGASQFRILFRVLIPATGTAALNGLTLVFIPCLGEFVIPDLLGGAKSMLVGNLITEQFLKARDWPFGAALSTVLILILFLIPIAINGVLKLFANKQKNSSQRQLATSESHGPN